MLSGAVFLATTCFLFGDRCQRVDYRAPIIFTRKECAPIPISLTVWLTAKVTLFEVVIESRVFESVSRWASAPWPTALVECRSWHSTVSIAPIQLYCYIQTSQLTVRGKRLFYYDWS